MHCSGFGFFIFLSCFSVPLIQGIGVTGFLNLYGCDKLWRALISFKLKIRVYLHRH